MISKKQIKELNEGISTIPGDGEWWHSSSEETFQEVGRTLIDKGGFTVEETIEILSECFFAVANEFGS